MAIAYDSSDAINKLVAPFSGTFTPVGTLKGVFVFVVSPSNEAESNLTSVTYGGVTMTKINYAVDNAGEPGCCWGYFLGASIPTGAQTVLATYTVEQQRVMLVIGVTAGADTELAGTGSGIVQGDTANPSVTITGISGASYGAAGIFSGVATLGSITAGTGMTKRQGLDFGAMVADSESSTSQNASGDLTIGFTIASDDVAMVAIAIQEVVTSSIKTFDGLARASTKTVNGLALASVKTWNGLA